MKDWVRPYIMDQLRKTWIEGGYKNDDIEKISELKAKEISYDESVFCYLTEELNCEFWMGGIGGDYQLFTEIFGSVLADLPQNVFEKISTMKNVFYIFTPQPGAEVKILRFEHDIMAGETIKIVNFPYTDLFNPLRVLRGEIAHEIAHIYAEHDFVQLMNGKTHEDQEDEADQLAMEWGFKDEIKELREFEKELYEEK